MASISVVRRGHAGHGPWAGVFTKREGAPAAVVLSGADALGWYSTAVTAGDLVFATWSLRREDPVTVYGGDVETLRNRLETGTVVLVASSEFTIDPLIERSLIDTPVAADWLGVGTVVCDHEPAKAAARVTGVEGSAMADLRALGARVTIVANAGSQLAAALDAEGSVAPVTLVVNADVHDGPSLAMRVAETSALGSFGFAHEPGSTIDGLLEGAEVTASAPAAANTEDAIRMVLEDPASADVALGGAAGIPSTFYGDAAAFLADLGPVGFADVAIPDRDLVLVSGSSAESLIDRLGVEMPAFATYGPPPGEDADRYAASQWVTAIRQARLLQSDAHPIGRPSIAAEAAMLGRVGPIDRATVASIAQSRGWHVIDPGLAPVIEPVLAAARSQLAGSDEAIPPESLAPLAEWGREPGFWAGLVSAVEPPEGDQLVFPYPAPSVELLRAAVAAEGDAARLRSWIGPVKAAIYRALGGERD